LKIILVAIIALVLVLVVLLAIAYGLLRTEPNRLAAVIEVVGSTVLQRDLVIGELLDADIGWDTYLLAKNVSLSNPSWTEEPEFARVGELRVRINLPSIWSDGPIIFQQLDISDASLNIYAGADQQAASWDFWPDDELLGDASVVEKQAEEDTNNLEAVFPVLFQDGNIHRSTIALFGPKRETAIVLTELSLKETTPDQPLLLDIAGSINDMPLTAVGSVGPSSSLLTLQNLEMNLAISWGELRVESYGSIADLANLSGPDLFLKIAAPRSRPLLDAIGLPGDTDGPLEFEGTVTDAKPGIQIDAQGTLDQFAIVLKGKSGKPRQLDDLDVNFQLSGSSIEDVASIFERKGFPVRPYAISGQLIRAGTRLELHSGAISVGEGHLALDGSLPNFPEIDDWEFSLEGGKFDLALIGLLLGIPEIRSIGYSVVGKLSSTDGGVELMELALIDAEGQLTVSGTIGEAPEYLGTNLTANITGNGLDKAGLWLGLHDLPAIPYRVVAEVRLDEEGLQLVNSSFASGGISAVASGKIEQLSPDAGLDLAVKASSDSLRDSLATLGYPVEGLSDYPIELTTTLSGSANNLRLDEFTFVSGESQARLTGELGDIVNAKSVELTSWVETPDLLGLLPAITGRPKVVLPVSTQGQLVLTEEEMSVKNYQGSIGGAQVTVNYSLNLADPYQQSDLQMLAEGPSLAQVLGPWFDQTVPDAPFTISADVDLKEGALTVDKLVASLGDSTLAANFQVGDFRKLTDAEGSIDFSGPDSEIFAEIFGLGKDLAETPFHLNVNLSKSPDWLKLDPVKLDWGRSDYTGEIKVRLTEVPEVDVRLHSDYVSISYLLPDTAELAAEEARQAAAAKDPAQRQGVAEPTSKKQLSERVIPNDPLDFSWLHSMQVSVDYTADVMHIRDDSTTSAQVSFSLKDGTLSSRDIHWDGTLSSGSAEFLVQATDAGVETDIYLDIQRLPLLLLLGGEPNYDPDAIYRARVRTRGNSLKEMAKNADGAIVFKGGGGRLDNAGLGLILGDFFEEFFDRLNPFSESDPDTKIRCHAGAATIVDGEMLVSPGLVVRTNKLDIASGGSLNLDSEKLDLAFNTKSRKGLGISASKAITPYFKIGGTLAQPSLVLDVVGAAVSGGAAVATAGISIVAEGLWDRWIATASNPCERLITQVSKERKSAFRELMHGMEPAKKR
jgi:uncharacterized protein involved in outer membrane biogenesis